MFGFGSIVAYLAKPLYGWLAAGLVLVVLGGALWLEHGRRVNAEDAKRVAQQATHVAERERDDAIGAANRWKNRSDQGDASIAQRDHLIATQSGEIEKMRVKAASLEAIARASAADAEVARQAAGVKAAELAAWGRANPDKVCRLSPEIRARAEAE
jgi:hypothetical protein